MMKRWVKGRGMMMVMMGMTGKGGGRLGQKWTFQWWLSTCLTSASRREKVVGQNSQAKVRLPV